MISFVAVGFAGILCILVRKLSRSGTQRDSLEFEHVRLCLTALVWLDKKLVLGFYEQLGQTDKKCMWEASLVLSSELLGSRSRSRIPNSMCGELCVRVRDSCLRDRKNLLNLRSVPVEPAIIGDSQAPAASYVALRRGLLRRIYGGRRVTPVEMMQVCPVEAEDDGPQPVASIDEQAVADVAKKQGQSPAHGAPQAHS